MKLYRYLILIILLFPTLLLSQVSEEAKNLYDEGKYGQAKLALGIDLENDPTNTTIHYLLGMAAMHTGDIETAEQALTFAKKKKVHDATLYLGRLYALQYKFEAAENEFTAYEKAMRRNKEALAVLEDEREYADRLHRLVTRTEDIQIIDSVVVNKNDFLNAYSLSLSGGSLEWAHDFFDGGFDNDNSVVFINERKTKVYFSRIATEQGATLYTMDKLMDNFGNEKMIPSPITNKQDQAYPFILSDGLTIYFASKGHETIGGYDLFASRLNLNSNTYLTPNQMNMPFNSPFNDYMMVVDEQKGVGWFASDRYQPEGQVCVYTFIPNQEVLLVQSEDIDTLANRAKISNIKDSWKSNADYTNLSDKASTKIVSNTAKEQDFKFVINDELTYYQLSDFKSFSAREHFIKAIELEEKLIETKEELENKRTQYASLPTASKSSMTFEILEMEKKVGELYDQNKIRKVMARNEEVRHINAL